MFHGFGNGEDLVAGASETGGGPKTAHVSAVFSLGFFNMGRTGLWDRWRFHLPTDNALGGCCSEV